MFNKFSVLMHSKPSASNSIHIETKQEIVPMPINSRFKFITNSDGFQEKKIIQKDTNIYNRIIYPQGNINENPNAIIYSLDNKLVPLCKNWVNYCNTHITEKKPMGKCSHQYNDIYCQHLEFPLCYWFYMNKCKNGPMCKFYHGTEYNALKTITPVSYDICKTFMCVQELLRNINPTNGACRYGYKCKYAHKQSDIKSIHDNFNIQDKFSLHEMYEKIVSRMYKHKEDIINFCRNDNKIPPRFSEPIPVNFTEWISDYNWLVGYTDICDKDFNSKLIMDITPLIKWFAPKLLPLCKKDITCQVKIMQGLNNTIKDIDICHLDINCYRGGHVNYLHNNTSIQICSGELYGNCRCVIKNHEHAVIKRKAIMLKIDELKTIHKSLIYQMSSLQNSDLQLSHDIKNIKNTIDSLMNEYINTYYKVHLIKDYGYLPITTAISNDKFDMEAFIELDTSQMSDADKIIYEERQERIMNMIKIKNEKKLAQDIKDNIHLEELEMKASKIASKNASSMEWYVSGAWKVIPIDYWSNLFIREVYANWLKNPLGCTVFNSFSKFISSKKDDYEVLVESNSTIKNYKNMWAWIYNIKLEDDTTIVNKHNDIIVSNPDLWVEYKEKYINTGYNVSFDEFIDTNIALSSALKIHNEYPEFGFTRAIMYVKNNLSSYVSYQIYCSYDNHTIVQWKMINDICKNNQMPYITIDGFIKDKSDCIDYYIYSGRFTYGTTINGYHEFKRDKASGWKICSNSLKFNEKSSLLALSLEQLKDFFKKQNTWSLVDMRKFDGYIPVIHYTLNTKACMITIFSSIVDIQIQQLYHIMISNDIISIIKSGNNTVFTRELTDVITKIKSLIDDISNADNIKQTIINEFPSRASSINLIKTQVDTETSPLIIFAKSVLTIFANVKSKRQLVSLKPKQNVKVIENDDSSDSDDSDDSSDESSDESSDSEDEDMVFKKPIKKPLNTLMYLGADNSLYIMNEPPFGLRIDKSTTARKVFIGPFEEHELPKLEKIVSIMKNSTFGKGCHLGAEVFKLEDIEDQKRPSYHITCLDRKIGGSKYKAKGEKQNKLEDEYGYDWVADMFVNIINIELNINIKEIVTNIFTLEARLKDHVIRKNRMEEQRNVEAIKKIEKPQTINIKMVKPKISKEEKTAMIRAKLEKTAKIIV